MNTFTGLIGATSNAYAAANVKLDALKAVNADDTAAFSRALLEAQMAINNAATMENRTSTVIATAYQAHSQVASR
jgi:hypothetical protein